MNNHLSYLKETIGK